LGAGIGIVTQSVVGLVVAPVVAFIALVLGAVDPVITIRRSPCLAILEQIAGFDSVAVQPIRAVVVIGRVGTRSGDLVTAVVGTGHSVVAGTHALDTPLVRVASLHPVAGQTIVTLRVVGHVLATGGRLVTGIQRAGHRVIAGICPVQASRRRVTHFGTIAEQAVVALGVIDQVFTGSVGFVANVCRAFDRVVTVDGSSAGATAAFTDFGAVTDQSVVAIAVVLAGFRDATL